MSHGMDTGALPIVVVSLHVRGYVFHSDVTANIHNKRVLHIFIGIFI